MKYRNIEMAYCNGCVYSRKIRIYIENKNIKIGILKLLILALKIN